MNIQILSIPMEDQRKIIGAASPESALLYLYLAGGGDLKQAEFTLRLSRAQLDVALASLRQLGLYQEIKPSYVVGEPPRYTESDLSRELARSQEFTLLIGEIQQRYGRVLTNEELKILLSFIDYLGIPSNVVSILFTFCLQRARQKGKPKPPAFHSIQKEAYRWAELGIDTLEEAASFVQNQLERQGQVSIIAENLQIHGRKLVATEERYINSWLEMGFGPAEIQLAYDRTCVSVGSLKWGYCNSILKSWHEQNLHTVAQIQEGDRRPASKSKVPMGAGNSQNYGDLERQAIEDLKKNFG